MVLTVTLNPLLERRYLLNDVKFNTENRSAKKILKAGGKGINVSRQLNKLGIENIALTFAGGVNGRTFKEILRIEGISFVDIKTRAETRDAAVIRGISNNSVSTFFSEDISTSELETSSFVAKLEKMIANCEMVIFSGSSPNETTDLIFPTGIEIANKLDKVSICDTYGKHFRDCIDAAPSIIHNNVDEIESSMDLSLKDETEKCKLLKYLYSKNIKQAFLTDGGNNIYCSNFDFHYKATVPKIGVLDATGSGDSFVAGVAYGWHNKLKFVKLLSFASAIGICNAQSFDTSAVEKEDVIEFLDMITIEPVGKKLKIINDKSD